MIDKDVPSKWNDRSEPRTYDWIFGENFAEDAADFADRSVGPHGVQDRRHQVL